MVTVVIGNQRWRLYLINIGILFLDESGIWSLPSCLASLRPCVTVNAAKHRHCHGLESQYIYAILRLFWSCSKSHVLAKCLDPSRVTNKKSPMLCRHRTRRRERRQRWRGWFALHLSSVNHAGQMACEVGNWSKSHVTWNTSKMSFFFSEKKKKTHFF